MIPVYSLFERIGLGGGGKVRAVIARMNALAEDPAFDPVLLALEHGPRQRLNFATLRARGVLHPRVRFESLPDACLPAARAAGVRVEDTAVPFDDKRMQGRKITYTQAGQTVMTDRIRDSPVGTLTRRSIACDDGTHLVHLRDGLAEQRLRRYGDGTVEVTDYAEGLPIRWLKTHEDRFAVARNLVTGQICRMPRIFMRNVFKLVDWTERVVFFDGITSAYLADSAKRRALFLHADHRGPDGRIVPRSRFLIENFQGEMILTSTQVHKRRLEADLTPAAPLRVVPHFCEAAATAPLPRRDLVTVSRLDLAGKPIDESIAAFAAIMEAFPQVDYVIYGEGTGRAALERQIADLGCGSRIRLAGYTDTPEAVFRGALAAVYPTLTEGFGLAILEALAAGCPVISNDVDYGPREMIVPGHNGELVPPGDIPALSDALARVLRAPERYGAATQDGLERYGRAAYIANYAQVVRDLAR
ncbi:glycosyltransferase [Sulfitobacter albidus]|uniref:Glycosyltransferase n=1 Tax=Sulfitobacter albidus TaxID=2829501 RepID=A0A975PMR6_9RHOB|nr:glycosyltransferase [Sulfitobacter albidus]QUJ77087.1 glycosyltransferase [Sulfitobacter albidus]